MYLFYFWLQTFCGCSQWGFSLVAVHRLLIAVVSHCGAQAIRCVGSVVVVHRLSCPRTGGIFPGQGLKLCPLHRQVNSLDHQGSPLSNSKHFHHPEKKPKAIK